MFVPQSWNLIENVEDPNVFRSDELSTIDEVVKEDLIANKRVSYLFKNNKLIERCEYQRNSANCYVGKTYNKLRSVKLDFTIIKALYCQLEGIDDMVDYLLLIGEDEICFYNLLNPNFETIKIPFKMENVVCTDHGILIERKIPKGEQEIDEPEFNTCKIFSLSHPYSEILPVLFKYRRDSIATFAFTGEEISLLNGRNNLFIAYDYFNSSHFICELRKCTLEEKKQASKCLNSTMIGFDSSIFSWKNTPSQIPPITSTPKLLNQTPQETTPLRRSIRNKAKQAANVDSVRLFQHDSILSNITPLRHGEISAASSSMFKSSVMSFRSTSKFSTMNMTDMYDNLEINEIDVDYILVHIWNDSKQKPKASFSRMILNTPNTRNTNKIEDNDSKDSESDVDFEEPEQKRSKDEPTLDFKGFPSIKRHKLLRTMDKIIKQKAQDVLFNDENKMEKMNLDMTEDEQFEYEEKTNKKFAVILKEKYKSGDEKALKLYQLIRHQKELYKIWKRHRLSHSKKLNDNISVKRLFVTVDKDDQEYIVVVYYGNIIKLLKWNKGKKKIQGKSTIINGIDAISIYGTKLIAILFEDKLDLYSGLNFVSTVNITPIDINEHDVLSLEESAENTVSILFQHRKKYKVDKVVYDLLNLSEDYLINNINDDIMSINSDMNFLKLTLFPTEIEQKKWISLRWPTDIRLENVKQMLDSSRLILIPFIKQLEWEDEKKIIQQYDDFLMATYPKIVSKAFGRAILNFSTIKASKVNFETIPKIELNGRIPHHNIHPFPNHELIQTQNEWAEFFAGASHVLSLTDFESDKVSFAWLKQWQEETTNSISMTAGCIFGYGLTGQFKNVNVYDIHKLLIASKRSMDSIAILLGIGIAFRGTSHLQCYRTVITHLPSFIEPTLVELKFEPTVHIASVLSLGFLFQGTTNSSITNKLINEMAKETFFENDVCHERYNYVFCAGVSVGLINLGRGVDIRNSEISIKGGNNEFDDRLYHLLNGGNRILCTDFGKRNQNLCKNQRIGIAALNSINPSNSNHCTNIDYAVIHGIGLTSETASLSMPFNDVNKTTSNSAMGILAKESSLTKELPYVNIHLTSPAACIALALTYLRTGDSYIINMLKVPNTIPLLEKIRPDVLMMRTLCGLMVDYDNILPDLDKLLEEWLPDIISKYIKILQSDDIDWYDQYVDFNTVVEAYFYIRTGVALAIGIRYASTFNEEAYKLLINFNPDLDPTLRCNTFLYKHIKESIIQNCSAVNGLAMALVMAGSGHLGILKYLRKVKNFSSSYSLHDTEHTVFSLHTLINMGIGMLFMGNARYGFSKTNDAIAMLLLSVFPIFSHNIADNRCYFLPMRLLWSLATEYRHLTVIDEETFTPIKVQAIVKYRGNLGQKAFTLPDLLPSVEDIETIQISGQNLQEILFDMMKKEDVDKFTKIMKTHHGRLLLKRRKRKFERVFDENFEKAGIKNMTVNTTILWDLPNELLNELV